MHIAGCDIGSETHYLRAIDIRGRELSKGAFEFSNTAEGFVDAKAWVLDLAAKNDKKQNICNISRSLPDFWRKRWQRLGRVLDKKPVNDKVYNELHQHKDQLDIMVV